jgi:aminoglycoside/choline kinase family phosphotransferase
MIGDRKASALPESIAGFLEQAFSPACEAYTFQPLAGDASDRSYVRVISGASASLSEPSFILMQLAEPWSPDSEGGELPFVNIARHLAEKGVRVPDVCVNASDQGFVLLEDMGDVTLESHVRSCAAGERDRCYREAVRLLVQMQKEASLPSRTPCVALSYAFDAETFFRELCFFREHAVEGMWGRTIRGPDRKELDRQFLALCREVAEVPQTFTHRDYHSRNLMVRAGGLSVLDFQDARLGPLTYDLASLLRDSYVALEPEKQGEMLDYYLDLSRARGGLPLEGAAFRRAFVRTGLQRNLKALGTFAYQAVVKGRDRYRESIPHTLHLVRLALEEDPDLAPLKRVLQTVPDVGFV